MGQKPGHGGHTWVLLQYVLGFRRLGWDVLLLDQLDPKLCWDAAGRRCTPAESINMRYLQAVVERFGLADDFALLTDGVSIGRSRAAVLEHTRNSTFLLNVMGFISDEEVLACAARRVYLDIDPGYGQMWTDLGLHDAFAGHDDFVTIGERVGGDGCTVPTCGKPWITTPQPVVLDEWPVTPANDGPFTSVGSWRGTYGTLEYGGRTYGQRVHEFRRFVELPRLTGRDFELALAIDPSETRDLDLLTQNGWVLTDPAIVAADPDAYRNYLRASKGEIMIAKNMYVQSASGWFSDRSICYLATGRPVIAQDTGLTSLYPTGQGLLIFTDVDEARDAIEEVCGDYLRHARAARSLAEERFESDHVLGTLLQRLGLA